MMSVLFALFAPIQSPVLEQTAGSNAGSNAGANAVAAGAVPVDEVEGKLAELQRLFEDVDCDPLLLAAKTLRAQTLTPDQRMRLLFLDASCSVAVGNISDAAARFDEVVREDIDVKSPFPLERRVELLLAAARAGEKQRRDDEAERLRRERAARVKLSVTEVAGITGGQRASFRVDVEDPSSVVSTMRVEFRRKGTFQFYSLPILRESAEGWRGQIPGSYTRTSHGMSLEWFIVASADDGTLVQTVGSKQAPRELVVGPGRDVATDLRAHERLPLGTRLLLTCLGLPGVSASALVLTGIVGTAGPSISATIAQNNPGIAGALGAVALGAGTVAATLAAWVAVEFLVDDSLVQKVVPAIVFGAGTLATLYIATLALGAGLFKAGVIDEATIVRADEFPDQTFVSGVIAGGLSLLVGPVAVAGVLFEERPEELE